MYLRFLLNKCILWDTIVIVCFMWFVKLRVGSKVMPRYLYCCTTSRIFSSNLAHWCLRSIYLECLYLPEASTTIIYQAGTLHGISFLWEEESSKHTLTIPFWKTQTMSCSFVTTKYFTQITKFSPFFLKMGRWGSYFSEKDHCNLQQVWL